MIFVQGWCKKAVVRCVLRAHVRGLATCVSCRSVPRGASPQSLSHIPSRSVSVLKRSPVADAAMTPMMRQYWEIKSNPQYAGYVLLFQLGNFLEAFFSDAERLSEVLGITLTSRGTLHGKPIPMAGIPMHAKDAYIARMVRKGLKIVICEQVVSQPPTNASVGKAGGSAPGTLLGREVSRIVTRGTVMDESLLTPSAHNYICAIHFGSFSDDCSPTDGSSATLAWLDVSTGDLLLATIPISAVSSQLAAFPPAEILIAANHRFAEPKRVTTAVELHLSYRDKVLERLQRACHAGTIAGDNAKLALHVTIPIDLSLCTMEIPGSELEPATITVMPSSAFSASDTTSKLFPRFDWTADELSSVAALCKYVSWTQGGKLPSIRSPARLTGAETSIATPLLKWFPRLHVDAATQRALEIVRPTHGRRRGRGSLLHTLDQCRTALGSRLLDIRLCSPLAHVTAITHRLDAVEHLKTQPDLRKSVSAALSHVSDLERCMQRLSVAKANARDLAQIRDGLLAAQLAAVMLVTGDYITHYAPVKSAKNPFIRSIFTPTEDTVANARKSVAQALMELFGGESVCPLSFSDRDFDMVCGKPSAGLPAVLLTASAACLTPLKDGFVDFAYAPSTGEDVKQLISAFTSICDALVTSASSKEGESEESEGVSSTTWIRKGYNEELDAARTLRDDATQAVDQLQQQLRVITGIKQLKLRRTDDLGYAVEVPTAFAKQLDDFTAPQGKLEGYAGAVSFSRVKTLKSSVRYRCGPVSKLDAQISMAAARAQALENAILAQLAEQLLKAAPVIYAMSRAVAVIDITCTLAALADEYRLCKPIVLEPISAIGASQSSTQSTTMNSTQPYLSMTRGRHLVVERALLEGWRADSDLEGIAALREPDTFNIVDPPGSTLPRVFEPNDNELDLSGSTLPRVFEPNDCELGSVDAANAAPRLSLICGPNMGGKSTYLRQTAHAVILAQMGSFVPADSLTMTVVDRLFSRIGAADDVTRDKSTFLMEMEETALIARQATQNSLVVVDEVGRGTSMLDGIAIASALLEHLCFTTQCRTLFATHMHELTGLILAQTSSRTNDTASTRLNWSASMKCLTVDVCNTDAGEPLLTHKIIKHPIYDALQHYDGTHESIQHVWRKVVGMSLGVHVARMARLPDNILRRASEILGHLDASQAAAAWGAAISSIPPTVNPADTANASSHSKREA